VLLDGTVAWNLYRTAKVDVGSDEFKKVVEIDERSVIDGLAVCAVVVPEVRGGRVRVETISATEALREIAPSTALQIPFEAKAVLRTLAALVRQVPCYRLLLGGSNDAAAAAVDKVLPRG
jgi:hypothetical protein